LQHLDEGVQRVGGMADGQHQGSIWWGRRH
jgi:hypothetical protein